MGHDAPVPLDLRAERAAYAVVIGKLILKLRNDRRMNQEKLAERAGLSQSALSRFENGQTLPDAFELRALAKAFDDKPDLFVAKLERAFERTSDAAKKVTPLADIAVAGVLAGLAIGAIAAILDESDKKGRGRS